MRQRLGVTDQPGDTAAGLEAQLGQLGALARAGLPGDDQHLMVPQGTEQFVVPGSDRKFSGIADRSAGDEGVIDGATSFGSGAAVHAPVWSAIRGSSVADPDGGSPQIEF